MKKGTKKSKKVEVVETVVNETPVVETPVTEVTVSNEGVKVETRGRKVDPNSPRQIRLAKQAANKAMGKDGRGRHVNPNSARQAKLAALEAKKAAGIEIKRGRPAGTGKKQVEEPKGE